MKPAAGYRVLFTDIGGVLLTNSWDQALRFETADRFGIDYYEMNERHHMTFDTYEEGGISLYEYLDRVVFYTKRPFTHADFIKFVKSRTKPFKDMIDLVKEVKARNGLRVVAVSNDGREFTTDRVRRFRLHEVVDFFVCSSFVHFRKPDRDIFQIALDCSQARPREVVYIDDRDMFTEVASGMGITGIHHKGYEPTRQALQDIGLLG